MCRSIRVDHTNCLQVAIKTHSSPVSEYLTVLSDGPPDDPQDVTLENFTPQLITTWFLAVIFPFFPKHYFEEAITVLKASRQLLCWMPHVWVFWLDSKDCLSVCLCIQGKSLWRICLTDHIHGSLDIWLPLSLQITSTSKIPVQLLMHRLRLLIFIFIVMVEILMYTVMHLIREVWARVWKVVTDKSGTFTSPSNSNERACGSNSSDVMTTFVHEHYGFMFLRIQINRTSLVKLLAEDFQPPVDVLFSSHLFLTTPPQPLNSISFIEFLWLHSNTLSFSQIKLFSRSDWQVEA